MSIIIENVWTIAPIAILDVPMVTEKFAKVDEETGELTGEYQTIREYCDSTTANYRTSVDGRYIVFGHEFSDLANDFSRAKGFAQEMGLTLGGADFTQTGDGLVWVLSYSETQRFLATNPMFQSVEE